MATRTERGDVWMYKFGRRDKQRPVVVLTRAEVIRLLNTVMVTPITSTIHGVPSEVVVGIDAGLKQDSAINLDHVQTVDKGKLKRRLGSVSSENMRDVCRALGIAAGCIAPG